MMSPGMGHYTVCIFKLTPRFMTFSDVFMVQLHHKSEGFFQKSENLKASSENRKVLVEDFVQGARGLCK